MKHFVSLAVLAVFVTSSIASAQSGSLEDRVKALEGKMDSKKEASSSGSTVGVSAYFDDGLRFKSSDNTFAGHLGAWGIFHYTNNATFNDGDGRFDGFSVKQVAIEAEARLWEAFSAYVRPQFFGGAPNLFLGWVEFNKWEEFKVKVGLMKIPYSQEQIEDVRWMDLPENSLLNLTAPQRDLGAMVHGNIGKGIFGYWAGLFNGNGPGGADNNSDKDVAVRLAVRPGANMEGDVIKNLTFAISYTRGVAGRNSGAPFEMITPATGTQFHFGPNTFESDYDRTRFGCDLVWIFGPLSVKGEFSYLKSKHEFATSHTPFRVSAYMGEVGFWIFGSTRVNGKRPQIKKALFMDGGTGDLQIVGRYSAIDMDDTFEEKAGWGGSRNAQEVALGLNYWPNGYVRISAMYGYYRYDHKDSRRFFTSSGQVIDNESVFIFRAQIDF